MASRLSLQTLLTTILGSDNVYYQSPANISMSYPAIKYTRKGIDNTFANNEVYGQEVSYEVTVIDPDPDSAIVTSVSKLPRCKFDRHYTSDNLNHDVFVLNF